MASVYYLFNFHMRKLERKAENFAGHRTDKQFDETDADYTATLDALVNAMQTNYKDWDLTVDLEKMRQ